MPTHKIPILVPDQHVSRNLRKHFCWFPGNDEPGVYNAIDLALDAVVEKGFAEFLLHTENATYHCAPSELALFASDHPQDDDPRQP